MLRLLKEEKLRRLESKLGYEKYFHWVKRYWTSRGESLDFKKHKYLLYDTDKKMNKNTMINEVCASLRKRR